MSKLAINGGEPVRKKPFPTWPVWDEREERALLEVLQSGQWGSLHEDSKVAQFERAFARAHDAQFGRCVPNGTLALEVALRALGIGYHDEVIVPPYTFLATATACLMVGAIPVFVDIDPDTYNIDPTKIEAAITPRTKAIIPVHIGGCPADLNQILEIAHRYGLRVIEDACQAVGASWKGRRVGAIGDLGCFSFQSSKNITAGEGGVILTNDEELAERCWSIRNCGRTRHGAWYAHQLLGGNYRMTEWQAAVLLAQLTRLEELAHKREENARYLAAKLAAIEGIAPQKRDPWVTQHAYHLFIFRYDASAFDGLPRERFLSALKAEGIPCSPGYIPLYRLPAIRDGVSNLKKALGEPVADLPVCPVTEKACDTEGVWLSQNMLLGTREDMDDIAAAILKVKKNAKSLL